jgi:hypothetical protein
MDRKTRFWILLFSALFVIGCGVFLLIKNIHVQNPVAYIYLKGELIEKIDLNAVAIPYEFTVESELGSNTIKVGHGSIAVVEADCPEQICVNQGSISDSSVPIVCLPHRLVIQIEGVDP